MHIPLEIIRLILDYLEPDATIQQLFNLRLVSSAFNAEILERLFLGTRIDAIFNSNFWTSYNDSFPRWYYPFRAVPPDEYHLRRKKAPFWCDFPDTLKPIYYHQRLKRREREEDRFWQLFRPIFDFSLAVKGLKEEDRHRAIQVDEVMQTLCEGISIRGDGKSERLLFDSKSYLQASQYVAKMKDNSEIIRSYHLAQLFRAIRIGDYENIRGALTRGARLDWPSACLGREPLLYAVRKGDETIVAILLTYGEYRDPRNRPRKLVSAMQLAAQLRNTRMMQLLLDHPLGIRQSSIHISSAEQDSDKNYARPVRWRRDVPERDEELHRIHKPPLLQQALNTVLIESIQCSDSDLFDFTINLNREAEEDMAKRALLQAIKTSNVTMATHIINSRIGSMIDLNAEEDYTPSILYTAITQKQHRSARVDLTRLLISHGADPNQKSWTPGFLRYDFHYQHNLRVLNHVEGDRHDLFKVLVESGARIEECKIENFVGQMINIFLLDEFGQVDWVKAALEKAAQESK